MRLIKKSSPKKSVDHFDRYFQNLQNKMPSRPTQIRVVSEKLELDYAFPHESTHQQYHVASIGKMFTAVIIQRLALRGLISLKNPIHPIFDKHELDGLFIYEGVDHAHQVTIEHLLSHTSGVADYFEGSTNSRTSFLDEIITNYAVHWTPEKLLAYTRDNQAAVGIPGGQFNYSDTGYILLGLIIEKITGKSFAQNLADEILKPLELKDTYLMFDNDSVQGSKKDIEKVWFNGVEISQFESLSCDWSGGGIISTTADLQKFSQALRNGMLIPPSTLIEMEIFPNKFRQGIYYGMGIMEIHFKEFFFLLGHLPKPKGHIGILSTHLFFDPKQEAHIIMNFGDNTRMVQSFKTLIEIENTLFRMQPG